VTGLTPEDELVLVDEAIKAIYTGAQEYQIQGRRITRANLTELLKRKKELEEQILMKNGTVSLVRWG
jgi:hypothetical protein